MNSDVKSKRIAFIIGSMGRGGAERVISILANDYAERGWKVDILFLLNNKCDYILNDKINIVPICNENASRIGYLLKWIFNIRRYIKNNKPSKIVSFIARINIITLLASLGLKKHIIISERNDPAADGRSFIVQLATYLLYPLAESIVFQTKWAQSCFPNRVIKKSLVISNPINVTVQASNKKQKKIVAVGRLLEQKNHSMLISAFKKVHKIYPYYKLYIYGEGKLRDILQKKIEELELLETVFLPGNVTNIHEMISDAEIFVLSSNYEGLSNALLEAMMMGISCISTDCAGSNETIINGKNGILIQRGNEEQLVKAIINLIDNRNIAQKMAEEGKNSVKYMSTENIISTWRKTIESKC